jgi:TonB family protein
MALRSDWAALAVAAALPLLAPGFARAAPDAAVALAAPVAPALAPNAGKATAQKAKKGKHTAKRRDGKAAALNRARVRPVAFTPIDGLELTPPQTEQEALEWLERDLSLKVGKRRQADDYPEDAVRFGWSGTALVDVLVAGNGAIKTIALGRTSGFRVLDEQAIEMVKRVSKLWVPARLRGRDTSVTVPIGFQMQTL